MLDPWQQLVIRGALGERADGKWQAFEVGLIVPRQNGKGAIIEALELYWLYMCDEDRLILHSAHEFKTAREGFLRIRGLIERTPELREQVRQFYASTGGECGIELLDGKRLRFVARSTGAGRGFSPDKLVLDEAYNLPDTTIEAVLPSVGARPNPQVWYTSSPGDLNIAPCDVLARVRRRGIKGEDPALAYFEWSAEYSERGEVSTLVGDPSDQKLWAQANPSLGIRKTLERIANFHATMSKAGFAREELGVGTWPVADPTDSLFGQGKWGDVAVELGSSEIVSGLTLGIAVSLDRSRSAIGSAGLNVDGKTHLEPITADLGTSWVIDECRRLQAKHGGVVIVDAGGPAGALLPGLEEAGVRVKAMTTSEACDAAANLYDAVQDKKVVHLNDPDLNAAVGGAVRRTVGDRWLLGRKDSGDITVLEAVQAAAWGVANAPNYAVEDSFY